jgi:hypothetical protein
MLDHFHGNIDAYGTESTGDRTGYRIADYLRPIQNNHFCPAWLPAAAICRLDVVLEIMVLSLPISLE